MDMNAAGLIVAFLGTLLLLRFGVGFHGDRPVVSVGTDWTKLFLSTEWGQRIAIGFLALGFLLQLLSQL
jgi:hypothetical protein